MSWRCKGLGYIELQICEETTNPPVHVRVSERTGYPTRLSSIYNAPVESMQGHATGSPLVQVRVEQSVAHEPAFPKILDEVGMAIIPLETYTRTG